MRLARRGRVATQGAAPPGPLPLGSQGSQNNWGAPVLPGSGRQGAQAEPLTPASPWAWAPLTPTATLALDPPPAPTRLVLTQVTSSSILLSWSPAPQPPLKYLMVWRPSKGGTPREVSTAPHPPTTGRAGVTPTGDKIKVNEEQVWKVYETTAPHTRGWQDCAHACVMG